jgi:hypothetical protein
VETQQCILRVIVVGLPITINYIKILSATQQFLLQIYVTGNNENYVPLFERNHIPTN